MRTEAFGDNLENSVNFIAENDRFSARTINRPLRAIYENSKDTEHTLQTASKMLFGDKESGYIKGVLEEFNIKNIRIFNKKYLRLPTGAFYYNTHEAKKNIDEEDDFLTEKKTGVYIVSPNTELFERQLADRYCFDLNEQYNNINIGYTTNNDDEEKGACLEYTCDVSKFYYTYEKVGDTKRRVISKKSATLTTTNNNKLGSYYDIITSFSNNSLSNFIKEEYKYGLEDVIDLSKIIDENSGYKKCYVYLNVSKFKESDDNENNGIYVSSNENFYAKSSEELNTTDPLFFIIDFKDTDIINKQKKIEAINRNIIEPRVLNATYNLKVSDNLNVKEDEFTLSKSVAQFDKGINVKDENGSTNENHNWVLCKKDYLINLFF